MKIYIVNIIMSITIEHLPNLSNPQLDFKKNKYPICSDVNLPKMFFVALMIGSRGSGKTYSACQLLKLYENNGLFLKGTKVDQRIILISPTFSANPVFTALKHLDKSDIYEHYSDSVLQSILDDIKFEKKETEDYKKKMKLWKKFLKLKHIEELDQHELMQLELMSYQPPKPPKYPNSVVNFMIVDDGVGSSVFKSSGPSEFTKFVLTNRHVSCNVIIMSQNLKAIPKSIRTNTSVFCIFKFASKKLVCEDLWEEVSNTITLPNFENIFEFATKKDHDFLGIDFTQDKPNRFKQNWDNIIKISS